MKTQDRIIILLIFGYGFIFFSIGIWVGSNIPK
jgi:hypothetical protein